MFNKITLAKHLVVGMYLTTMLSLNLSAQNLGESESSTIGNAADAVANVVDEAVGATEQSDDTRSSSAGSENLPGDQELVNLSKNASQPKDEKNEYDLRIRELEGRVNDLKERIFRSKAKLTLLTAALTGGSLGEGASLTIVHQNQMGGSYKLTEVNYFLDGAPLWQMADEEGQRLEEKDRHVVWDGNIVEGSHTLSVEMVYKGTGFRLFNYHEDYSFTLRDSYTFTLEAGQALRVDAIGFERGNLTLEPEDRPAIRFDTKLNEQGATESVDASEPK